jgi:hypothetical protein
MFNRIIRQLGCGLLVVLMSFLSTVATQAALVELRTGPVAAMAIHMETDWSRLNLFAGSGLALPGFIGSPLRHPSLTVGVRLFTQSNASLQSFLTGQYGWVMRSHGLEPFAGGGVGLAWRFGPNKSYRLTMETDLLLRNSWTPYPSVGLGLAVRL